MGGVSFPTQLEVARNGPHNDEIYEACRPIGLWETELAAFTHFTMNVGSDVSHYNEFREKFKENNHLLHDSRMDKFLPVHIFARMHR